MKDLKENIVLKAKEYFKIKSKMEIEKEEFPEFLEFTKLYTLISTREEIDEIWNHMLKKEKDTFYDNSKFRKEVVSAGICIETVDEISKVLLEGIDEAAEEEDIGDTMNNSNQQVSKQKSSKIAISGNNKRVDKPLLNTKTTSDFVHELKITIPASLNKFIKDLNLTEFIQIRKLFELADLNKKTRIKTSEILSLYNDCTFITVDRAKIYILIYFIIYKNPDYESTYRQNDFLILLNKQDILFEEYSKLMSSIEENILNEEEEEDFYIPSTFNEILVEVDKYEVDSKDYNFAIASYIQCITDKINTFKENNPKYNTLIPDLITLLSIVLNESFNIKASVESSKFCASRRNILLEYAINQYNKMKENYLNIQDDFVKLFNKFQEKASIEEEMFIRERDIEIQKQELESQIKDLQSVLKDKEYLLKQYEASSTEKSYETLRLTKELKDYIDKYEQNKISLEKSNKKYEELLDEINKFSTREEKVKDNTISDEIQVESKAIIVTNNKDESKELLYLSNIKHLESKLHQKEIEITQLKKNAEELAQLRQNTYSQSTNIDLLNKKIDELESQLLVNKEQIANYENEIKDIKQGETVIVDSPKKDFKTREITLESIRFSNIGSELTTELKKNKTNFNLNNKLSVIQENELFDDKEDYSNHKKVKTEIDFELPFKKVQTDRSSNAIERFSEFDQDKNEDRGGSIFEDSRETTTMKADNKNKKVSLGLIIEETGKNEDESRNTFDTFNDFNAFPGKYSYPIEDFKDNKSTMKLDKSVKSKNELTCYDYLALGEQKHIQSIMEKYSEDASSFELYSDYVYEIKESKRSRKILFINGTSLYMLRTNNKVKSKMLIVDIDKVSLSKLNSNLLCIHFKFADDLLIEVFRRVELIQYFKDLNKIPKYKEITKLIKFKYSDNFKIKRNGQILSIVVNQGNNFFWYNDFGNARKMSYMEKYYSGFFGSGFAEKIVVLTEVGIMIFEEMKDKQPKQMIPISSSKVYKVEDKKYGKRFCFEIKEPGKETDIFCCKTEEDLNSWIKEIDKLKLEVENKQKV